MFLYGKIPFMKKQLLFLAAIALLVSCSKPATDDGTVLATSNNTGYNGSGYNPNGVGGMGAGTSPTGYFISATVDGKAYTCYTVGNIQKSKPPAPPSISLGGSMVIAADTYAISLFVPQYYGPGLYKGTQKAVLAFDNTKGATTSFSLPLTSAATVANDLTVSVILDDAVYARGAFSATLYDVPSMFNNNPPLDTMFVTNGSFYAKY